MNKKMVGLAYGAVVCSRLKTPSEGNRIIGNSEDTAKGAASVIHQVIIHAATPRTSQACGVSDSKILCCENRRKSKGPEIRPTVFEDNFMEKLPFKG
jgi:hypothetical protein